MDTDLDGRIYWTKALNSVLELHWFRNHNSHKSTGFTHPDLSHSKR